MWSNFLLVGVSGFFGSVTRYAIYLLFNERTATRFPWATLFINVSGCFAIGALSVILERATPNHRHLYLMGAVGFLGAFTTFSTFGNETFGLMRSGASLQALMNVAGNVVLGVAMVWAGRAIVA